MRIDCRRVRVTVSFSFAAVIVLMLIFCEEEIVLISLFSSLFHESGHLFFMLLFSDAPESISFGAFGIRIERERGERLSYKKEAIIALGGIIGNFILAFLSLLFYYFSKRTVCFKLFGVNAFVALFNLLPVRQLDAGRFAECILKSAVDDCISERVMSVLTVITVLILSVGCIIYNIYIGLNVSLIAVTAYLIFITIFKEFNNDK